MVEAEPQDFESLKKTWREQHVSTWLSECQSLICHLIPTIYGSYRAIWDILKERLLAARAPSNWHPDFTLDELRKKGETTKSRKLTWGHKPV